MRLIFIRHGEPDYSIDSLTEKGWREAAYLAERVKKWDVTDVYCSPLGRAIDTSRDSLEALGKKAVVLPWLQEFYIPVKDQETGEERIPWDFLPEYWTKVPQMYERDGWLQSSVMVSGNVADAYQQVTEGMDQLLSRYGYHRDGFLYRRREDAEENVTLVFFCHLGVIMTIMSHLLGIAQPLLTHGFFLAPTSVTVLNAEERAKGVAYFRTQVMGDTRHLAQAGELVSRAGYFTEPFQG